MSHVQILQKTDCINWTVKVNAYNTQTDNLKDRPMGYLCLSVSIPAYVTPPNSSSMMWARASAFSMPCRAPTNTVLLGKCRCEGQRTKLLSVITHGITCTCVERRESFITVLIFFSVSAPEYGQSGLQTWHLFHFVIILLLQ